MRDLILLVYLNNKYGKGKNDIPELKEILGYSTGGIYSALDSSGHFERTPTGIKLTGKGEDYLKGRILPQFSIYTTLGDVLVLLGAVFLIQWIERAYLDYNMIFPWHFSFLLIGLGLFVRFFILRFYRFVIKRRKNMTPP